MRKSLVITLFCFALAGMALQADNGAKELDEKFTKAMNANDIAAILALYAPDAVIYPPDAMEAKGQKAIGQHFAEFLGAYKITDFEMMDTSYEEDDELSVGWGRFSLTATPKTGTGPTQRFAGRFTSVAKKKDDRWWYISDHASAPMPPMPPAPPTSPTPPRPPEM